MKLKISQAKVKELQMKLGKFGKAKSTPTKSVQKMTNTEDKASTSTQAEIIVEVELEDWLCLVCEENVVEDMVQCLLCKKWAHECCAGSKAKTKKFVCSKCE